MNWKAMFKYMMDLAANASIEQLEFMDDMCEDRVVILCGITKEAQRIFIADVGSAAKADSRFPVTVRVEDMAAMRPIIIDALSRVRLEYELLGLL